MISDKIKALFQYIEYLHSNIENFNQFSGLIKELEKLNYERANLKPEKNYKDKLLYDNIQAELDNKFKILQDGTANLIKNKAKELNVCNPDKTETLWNRNISEIDKLKKEFDEKDLSTIFEHKNKYIQFRTETAHNYFSLKFFFDDLDEILKELFDYFKESENENEFEKFESKEIKVDSIALMLKLFKEKRNPCKCELEFLIEKQLLCNDCNIKTEIENGLINQIEFQVNEQKEILTKEQFNKWLDNEISTIQNSIKKLSLQKLQCEKGQITIFKNIWNRTYIFNKESIKVLNKHKDIQNLESFPPKEKKNEGLNENTEPNNMTVSTIEDWLFEFKEGNILTEHHYTTLVNALAHFFENGVFPKLKETIKVGRVNKKLLGWHLNRIFHSEGKGVEIELLSFAKANISTFKDVEFDNTDIQNCNLYKYFTTKTK